MTSDDSRGHFDRLADRTADLVASPLFFLACVGLIVAWLPLGFILGLDTWQLVINTATTIITFLLVALLHNGQHRGQRATNERLQALSERLGDGDPVDDAGQQV